MASSWILLHRCVCSGIVICYPLICSCLLLMVSALINEGIMSKIFLHWKSQEGLLVSHIYCLLMIYYCSSKPVLSKQIMLLIFWECMVMQLGNSSIPINVQSSLVTFVMRMAYMLLREGCTAGHHLWVLKKNIWGFPPRMGEWQRVNFRTYRLNLQNACFLLMVTLLRQVKRYSLSRLPSQFRIILWVWSSYHLVSVMT